MTDAKTTDSTSRKTKAKGAKRNAKRTYRKKRTGYPKTSHFGVGLNPRATGVIKWSGERFSSTGPASIAVFTMAANSLYDPDYQNNMTNDQPTYFDVLQPLYSKYYVKAVTGTVRVCSSNCKVIVFPTNELLTLSLKVWDEVVNYRHAITRLCTNMKDEVIIKFKFTSKDIIGRPNPKEDDDYTGYLQPTASNPFNLWFINVLIIPFNNDDQPYYFNMNTYQSYEMWEPVTQPRS